METIRNNMNFETNHNALTEEAKTGRPSLTEESECTNEALSKLGNFFVIIF